MNDRVLPLNTKPVDGKVVIYLMSRDQRVHDNHALLVAQQTALKHHVPLVVAFQLLKASGVRAREHFAFMLDGLEEVATELKSFNIPFRLLGGDIVKALHSLSPAAVYTDFSPLKGPQKRAKRLAEALDCLVAEVDTHNIIPVWVLSQKQEFAARTIRPKVHRLLPAYLVEPAKVQRQVTPAVTLGGLLSFDEARQQLQSIPSRGITIQSKPGSTAAMLHLGHFVNDSLATYANGRNDIATDQQSGLSPYLHFGQLSSLRVALEVTKMVDEPPLLFTQAKMPQAGDIPSACDGMNALFEEMIVRKELSDNFCYYSPSYKRMDVAAAWAQATLQHHATDRREILYTREQLEAAETYDDAWNAAQTELTRTGKMHGYMRMYWAKKILEWSPTPQEALDNAIYLNDAYSIDGGDPNGYVGILWAIAGLHDRPWVDRPIFGKIRYMNQAGLQRKFDLERYVSQYLHS